MRGRREGGREERGVDKKRRKRNRERGERERERKATSKIFLHFVTFSTSF
jgi:hypothetical protein